MKNNPIKIFSELKDAKNLCFLHSAQGGKSIIAHNPVDKYVGKKIEEFKKFCAKNKKNLLIGYLSYDLSYQLHNIKKTAKDDTKLPHIYFLAFDKYEEFQSRKPKNSIINNSNNSFQKPDFKKYKKAFEKIKHYIKEGDIYQINLTHRLETTTKKKPKDLFLEVIENNPVNYLAYIETENFEVLSASPERFIKIEENKIETCPIKGTRPKGKTEQENKELIKELLESEKEQAELNMITDLLRNDLGKVCKIGTVKVEGHRLIQECPTVWHTYSKITGELKESPIDALLSMFPGGSITGCPKKRAIEIIDELEPKTRGIYTGIIGYISPNQKILDFNIAIRTIIKKGKKLYLQVGGGIVLDSNLEEEYKETLDKAKSFTKIL